VIALPEDACHQHDVMSALYGLSRSTVRTIITSAARGPQDVAGSSELDTDTFADLVLVWREQGVDVARDRLGLCRENSVLGSRSEATSLLPHLN
jgi:hypothetical protein